MTNEFLLYLSIFAANIVQGITGFAGAILAMPPAVHAMGMGVAVPVLNGMAIVSGAYVLVESGADVDRKVLRHVVAILIPCGLLGIFIRRFLSHEIAILYDILGVIVLLVALQGFARIFRGETASSHVRFSAPFYELMVGLAGVVHGMYACGGPIMVGYLANALPQKSAFRSTVSAVWVVLNTAMLVSQLVLGEWNLEILRIQLVSIPFILAGMYIGSLAYKKVNQRAFMLLVYVLLVLSAFSLLMR